MQTDDGFLMSIELTKGKFSQKYTETSIWQAVREQD